MARAIPPAHAFRAHTAPLGIAFIDGPAAPPAYRGSALVALHGSWNRTEKAGYEVVLKDIRPEAVEAGLEWLEVVQLLIEIARLYPREVPAELGTY